MTNLMFNFDQPFTMAEFLEFHKLGSPNDPQITRQVSEALKAKGYTPKFHKRGKRWAKWAERSVLVLPHIP